jgi:hypothetical protein
MFIEYHDRKEAEAYSEYYNNSAETNLERELYEMMNIDPEDFNVSKFLKSQR